MKQFRSGARISGDVRDKLGAELKRKYERGASIRELAEGVGRSYGFVHRLLEESGANLRSRGGPSRKKASK